MDQEQDAVQVPTCALCGARQGSQKLYRGRKDENLYLCVDCLKEASRSLTDAQLAEMTVKQLRRHMEVRDDLAAAYNDAFTPTKTFYVGKKHDVPILEVDEEHELWALPKAKMPMAQSISSIVDIEVTLNSDDIGDNPFVDEEVLTGVKLKDLLPYLRYLLGTVYKSKHLDLAPIPKGHFVSYLYLILILDDQESGISKVKIDLLPFMISWPSHVDAGYNCAYDVIECVKRLVSDDYDKRWASGEKLDLGCNDRLYELVENGLMTEDEAEVLEYYLERMPAQGSAEVLGSSHGLVKSVLDAVIEYLVFGEKAPDLKTQHTVEIDSFLSAFYRYAPGLAVGDVVYLVDDTKIHTGKGGLLFARDSFAVDDFTSAVGDSALVNQPIAYDDLLYVRAGEKKNQLVLAFQDGGFVTVNGGKYAHFIFAAVNCILLLRNR